MSSKITMVPWGNVFPNTSPDNDSAWTCIIWSQLLRQPTSSSFPMIHVFLVIWNNWFSTVFQVKLAGFLLDFNKTSQHDFASKSSKIPASLIVNTVENQLFQRTKNTWLIGKLEEMFRCNDWFQILQVQALYPSQAKYLEIHYLD